MNRSVRIVDPELIHLNLLSPTRGLTVPRPRASRDAATVDSAPHALVQVEMRAYDQRRAFLVKLNPKHVPAFSTGKTMICSARLARSIGATWSVASQACERVDPQSPLDRSQGGEGAGRSEHGNHRREAGWVGWAQSGHKEDRERPRHQ